MVGPCTDVLLAAGSDGGVSDITLAVIVAISTLIGTSVGGAITGFLTLQVEERRHRRNSVDEERRFEERLLAGARVVHSDLLSAEVKLRTTIETRLWPPIRVEIPTVGWSRWGPHHSTLAVALSSEDWHTLLTAAAAVESFARSMEIYQGVGGELPDQGIEGLNRQLQLVARGREALEPLVYPGQEPSQGG